MRYLPTLLLTLGLAACAPSSDPASSTSNPATPKSPSTAGSWAAVDQTLDSYLQSAGGSLSGYGFAAFDRSGVLHTRFAGDYTADTAIRIASATKVPSAAAILTLVDDGLLDLDEPVATYIKQAGNPIVWSIDKRKITMRMLLAHTSGLPGSGKSEPNCLDQVLSVTLQQCAALIAAVPVVSPPGRYFNYGGADYQVAGYIATLIAGTDWQTFFNEAIAAPLSLQHFTYGDPAVVTNPRIAGGANTDVGDYVRIMQMLQNNGRVGSTQVLSPASVAVLKQNQIEGLPILFAPFTMSARSNFDGYTLGFWISDASQYPGSPGPEFSDPGLFGTTPWIDDGLGYGAVILIDDRTQTGLDMWAAVRPLIISIMRQ
ncbi:serine hydrolase domain-containing protein [Sinimarinibacterium sp. CAU 1509]|uniref:serine hydrolase domain-containing protein n=1 Tax=Sinimarinibacterium sp. CAU 1509 TaxID=2562283 RepID=UPI00146CA81A|nr:serine hydrolase domain-containing protein [Sinimarinibacterium sp. CAU 1509]